MHNKNIPERQTPAPERIDRSEQQRHNPVLERVQRTEPQQRQAPEPERIEIFIYIIQSVKTNLQEYPSVKP